MRQNEYLWSKGLMLSPTRPWWKGKSTLNSRQYFLLPQCFLLLKGNFTFTVEFILSSANAFNLDELVENFVIWLRVKTGSE